MNKQQKIAKFINSLSEAERLQVYQEYEAWKREQQPPEAFTAFKQRHWYQYQHTPFLDALDEKLQQSWKYLKTDGKEGLNRLIVTAPPRHGKSDNVRHFVAYCLANMPHLRVILASYSHHLAQESARLVRNLMLSDQFTSRYPGAKIDRTRSSVRQFEIAGRPGGVVSAGVGGSITGFGANLIVIDDPVKSRAEAESRAYQQRLINWYNADLRTRLQPPGVIIVVATRWSENDLSGYLLENNIEDWQLLHLPALAESDDLLGRDPGAALWPDRFPVGELHTIREQLGSYDFEALYQGRPRPRDAGLFDTDKIEIVDIPPKVVKQVRFWDLAVSAKSTADYTASVLLGVTEDEQFVIMDVTRQQTTPARTGDAILQRAFMDGRETHIFLEAENSARVQLDYLLQDERLRPYTVKLVTPQGDKFTRAAPMAARVEAGRVLMLKGEFNRAFLDELAAFPHVRNDDQTDALSGAYGQLANHAAQGTVRYARHGFFKKRGIPNDPRPGAPDYGGHPFDEFFGRSSAQVKHDPRQHR